jgi:hypothetical protein
LRLVGDADDQKNYEKIEIINHFFIKGMSINRSLNGSLNDLKMLTSHSGDTLSYIDKDDVEQ